MADAFSAIHGLQLRLMLIMSPVIRSKHKNSGGIGEYTRSFPQFGHRIREKTAGEMLLFGSNEDCCAFDLDFEDWFPSLGRPPLYLAGCKVESRPMPRALDDTAFQFTLGQWSSEVRAGVSDSEVFACDVCDADWLALVLHYLHIV